MRRMAFAVLAVATALFTGLFTASVAGAQAPAATISVTGTRTTWSPSTVTVTTGETVRWSFDGADAAAQRPRDERQLEPAAAVADRHRPGRGRLHVHRARRLHVPLRRPRLRHVRHRHRRGPGRRPARERARVLGDGRLPPRLDPRGHRGDPGARGGQRLRRSTPPRTPRSSTAPTSPSTTPSSSSPRPATSSTTSSRPRSRATCAPAAATSASTPRPTPSTRGRGTARCSAATSATTPPAPPPRRSHIEDTDEPSTAGPAGQLGADGRVVQLPILRDPERQRRR